MKWNNDRSLLLSRVCVCVWVFTVLLAALLLTAPWFWNWILWRSSVRMVYIGVTYASGVPAAVVLFCLHRLLRNISEEEVFIQENVGSLRIMSCLLYTATRRSNRKCPQCACLSPGPRCSRSGGPCSPCREFRSR